MVSTNDIVVENAPIVNIPQEPIEGTNGSGAGCIIEDDFDKAQKKYQLGKKNLLLSKYDDAVNNIGDACKVYSTKFGEFAPECAEVYFYYGKALLELARVENTVLGNALNGVPEDTGPINDDSRYGNPDDVAAEEKEDIADKVIDAMCEDPAAAAAAATTTEPTPVTTETTTTTETPAAVVEPVVAVDASGAASAETETTPATTTTTETKTEEAVVEGEEEDGDDDEEDDGGEDGEDGEEDLTKNNDETKNGVNGNGDEAEADDISNLQRSWEMFELAKLVFSKNFDNDLPYKTKRIAECLIKLGEISIEQELYEQAIIDIKESIRMQEEKQANERDERMLAESYYQFGLAYQFSEQFQLAGEQYQKSINILQLRIDKLKGLVEQTTSDDFEKQQFKDEITEIETILPEMVSKLEEIKEQGEQSVKLIQEAKECFLNKVNNDEVTTGTTTTTTEVKDITSLVKSKRKISSSQINIDGENGSEESAIKKTKVEEVESTTTTTETETTPTETTTTTETPIETDNVTTA